LNKQEILEVKSLINSPKRIVLVIHYSPDGDAIGSALAMAIYLQKKGHIVHILSPNPFPDFLKWMPQSDTILLVSNELERCEQILQASDLIFCLDFNVFERTGLLQSALKASQQPKIMLDHHLYPPTYFDYMYSEPEKTSSTAELIYFFIAEMMEDKHIIDKQIAECLYVGIITDTGSLSYSCNNDSTYKVLQDLVSHKIDGERIHQLVYQTYTESRIRLLGYCLSTRLTVLDEYATSFIYLTKEDLERFNYKHGDVDGIVNYGLSMINVRFAALFYQKEDRIRISFRSKGDFDTNVFARNHFEGGGHKNASGGNFYRSMEEALEVFKNAVKLYKNQLLAPWE
jgi:phosphoesterase RecJ-like protein